MKNRVFRTCRCHGRSRAAAHFQAHLRAFLPTLHDEGELEDAICWLSTFCSISSMAGSFFSVSSMANSRCHSRRVCVLSLCMYKSMEARRVG